MPKNKDNEFDVSLLEADISAGIDKFINKHKEDNDFTTDYSVEKKCGLSDNAIRTIRNSGGASLKTICRLGLGVGYKPRSRTFNVSQKEYIKIVIRVLKDFEGK
jgi:hypothetical protein